MIQTSDLNIQFHSTGELWNHILQEDSANNHQLWAHYNDELQFHSPISVGLPRSVALYTLGQAEHETGIKQALHPRENDISVKYYIRTPSEPTYMLYVIHDEEERLFGIYYGMDGLQKKIIELDKAIHNHKFTHKMRVCIQMSVVVRYSFHPELRALEKRLSADSRIYSFADNIDDAVGDTANEDNEMPDLFDDSDT